MQAFFHSNPQPLQNGGNHKPAETRDPERNAATSKLMSNGMTWAIWVLSPFSVAVTES